MRASIALAISAAALVICMLRADDEEELFRNLLLYVSVIEINRINSTAVMLGSQEIGIEDLPLALLGFISIATVVNKRRIDRSVFVGTVVFLTVIIFGLTLSVLLPRDIKVINGSWDQFYLGNLEKTTLHTGLESIKILMRVLVFIVILWAASSYGDALDYKMMLKSHALICRGHCLFGLFELFSKYVFGSDISIRIAHLLLPDYSTSVVRTVFQRGSLYALQGLTREPSHFAMAMFFSTVIAFLHARSFEKGRKASYGWSIVSLLLMLLSGAFTSVVLLIAVCILLLVHRHLVQKALINPKVLVACLCATPVLLLSVLVFREKLVNTFYWEKLQHVLSNLPNMIDGQYSSFAFMQGGGVSRVISMIETARVFLQAPLFGVGLGNVSSSSGVMSALGSVGLLGFFSWIVVLTSFSKQLCKDGGIVLVTLIVLTNLITIVSGFMYSTIWIALAGCVSIAVKEESKTSEEYCVNVA